MTAGMGRLHFGGLGPARRGPLISLKARTKGSGPGMLDTGLLKP